MQGHAEKEGARSGSNSGEWRNAQACREDDARTGMQQDGNEGGRGEVSDNQNCRARDAGQECAKDNHQQPLTTHVHIYIYIHMYTQLCIHIYIYIYRERERCVCMCVYIYIYTQHIVSQDKRYHTIPYHRHAISRV